MTGSPFWKMGEWAESMEEEASSESLSTNSLPIAGGCLPQYIAYLMQKSIFSNAVCTVSLGTSPSWYLGFVHLLTHETKRRPMASLLAFSQLVRKDIILKRVSTTEGSTPKKYSVPFIRRLPSQCALFLTKLQEAFIHSLKSPRILGGKKYIEKTVGKSDSLYLLFLSFKTPNYFPWFPEMGSIP